MKTFKVIRKIDSKLILSECKRADSFMTRFLGLMGKSTLADSEGLWIEPCNSIHTFFMRFNIDVAYLDSDGKVLKVTLNMRPWRLGLPVLKARSVVEANAGKLEVLHEGDILCLN